VLFSIKVACVPPSKLVFSMKYSYVVLF